MAKQRVGNTALGAATCRLIEQFQPEETRLFNDPVVKDLVGTPIRALTQFESMRKFTIKQTDAIMPGIYGAQICRTRFTDDAVQAALSQGIAQVVILGAGLDTRPYRLAGMEHVKVLEVDLPSVQEDKKKRLQKHFGRLPEQVTFVPIDFDTQSLEPSSAASFLKPFHLHLIADVGNAEYQASYLKPLGRNLVVSEAERIIQATVICP